MLKVIISLKMKKLFKYPFSKLSRAIVKVSHIFLDEELAVGLVLFKLVYLVYRSILKVFELSFNILYREHLKHLLKLLELLLCMLNRSRFLRVEHFASEVDHLPLWLRHAILYHFEYTLIVCCQVVAETLALRYYDFRNIDYCEDQLLFFAFLIVVGAADFVVLALIERKKVFWVEKRAWNVTSRHIGGRDVQTASIIQTVLEALHWCRIHARSVSFFKERL